tara:strand:- start:4785 stop:5171 length:387 start_codon:yes stop_codon:yes gene_type:complete
LKAKLPPGVDGWGAGHGEDVLVAALPKGLGPGGGVDASGVVVVPGQLVGVEPNVLVLVLLPNIVLEVLLLLPNIVLEVLVLVLLPNIVLLLLLLPNIVLLVLLPNIVLEVLLLLPNIVLLLLLLLRAS